VKRHDLTRERASGHRAGYVAVVGRPNVGKSTLLNRLVGQKLSIVSRKPQTTRLPISGIVTGERAQVVFVDTPGYQTEHRSGLNRVMNRSVLATLQEVHAALWIVEALTFDRRDRAIGEILPKDLPVVLAINKIDRVRDRRLLLPFLEELARLRAFAALVPISAARGTQLAALLDAVSALLPEGPNLFEPDELTTVSERVLAAELLREKLFNLLGDELPYTIAVEIDEFRLEGGLRRIHAAILVGKEGHKGIVIGKGGAHLKTIATRARQDMERLFGGKVFLEVMVRVRKGWADDAAVLSRLGYDAPRTV
jgi:GTP-binding protein Era